MTELPKTFDPAAIESRWYKHWEDNGLFAPERPGAEPWTIVNPPPNVTGSLHIGHALDNTLQDILTRHARLKGKDALWVVGTDHAGIATQMVVERNLATQGIKRTDMPREAFVDHVWEWKAQSGGEITRQLRRLGCSMDWANEQFTMDPHFSKAVLKVFVDLYSEGLLYRDKRLVNWDPGLKTAISDLEVEQREVRGSFWHFRYPLEDGSGYIAIATTRPETILGDGAVAVNPADERYAHLVGKRCKLPIVDRLIPIIADDYVRQDFGSGAVKITAAHDHNDYEVYKRHPDAGIPLINLMNADATMNDNCPADYRGLDRYDARKKVVADFEAMGLLDKIEDHVHQVPYGDRSGVVIEPWLTDQWYVDAATLAKPAIEAVRSGAIRIVPKTWEKTFFNWMENIQPWCVSRQLWWGHRIPAWFADDGRIFVAETAEEAQRQAGEGVALRQDEDVLDTWFSSALWPFATLGWPDSDPPRNGEGDRSPSWATGGGAAPSSAARGTAPPPSASPTVPLPVPGRSLNGRYPNDVLVSGFDILFFWNARMMMQGLHFMGDQGRRPLTESVPFKTLYLHGLVRAADGAKMSKSKGNTVDPLGLIDRYGADALRFFMAAMESQGRDIKMDEKRVEGYRNFATKLWNAARFCQANGIGGSATLEPPAARQAVNKWIVAETIACVQAVDLALADYRFDGAANAIYQFVWSRFCDWYVELIKPVSSGEERGAIDDETKAVAGWVLDQILVLLHPFMPFITEELWHALAPREHELIIAHWPMPDARAIDPEASREIDWLIRLVGEVRAARTELNVPPGAYIKAFAWTNGSAVRQRLERHFTTIERLARSRVQIVAERIIDDEQDDQTGDPGLQSYAVQIGLNVQVHIEDLTLMLDLGDSIDLAAERARLAKGVAAAEKERDALAGRLGNTGFVERAKPEAVDKARADHADRAAEAERLSAALARLG